MTPDTLTGLLAEPARMRVLAAVALGARTDAEAASAAGLAVKEAAMARFRLVEGGVLVAAEKGWVVDYAGLREAARERAAAREGAHLVEDEGAEGLGAHVRGRRLVSLPSRHSRRQRVLEHIAATTFTAGEQYDERAVNERLLPWCQGGAVDHVAVRRYLVDGGLLVRGNGVYSLPSPHAAPEPCAGERYVRTMGLA